MRLATSRSPSFRRPLHHDGCHFQDGAGESRIRKAEPRTEVHIRSAGFAAEMYYCELVGGCPAERHPSLSKDDDDQLAWAAAQEACPENLAEASALLAQARSGVAAMVIDEWERIERLGMALWEKTDRNYLTVREIHAELPGGPTSEIS